MLRFRSLILIRNNVFFSHRVASPEEEANQRPYILAIIGDAIAAGTLPIAPVDPAPVVSADNDLKVECRVPKMCNYDLTVLRMKKGLANDRGKLASFRKGVRWALLSAMKIWEPERVSGLPGLDASDAKWIGELQSP
eukprot:9202589-Heterocapsa_arctica.AAC.1